MTGTTPYLATSLTMATAQVLQSAVVKARQATAELNQVFTTCDTAKSTSAGDDMTVFELGNTKGPGGGPLNLIGVGGGRGQNLFDALFALKTSLNDTDLQTALARLDQGTGL